jgi:RNA:NAD 2'-phosphotransferase (TPT1/KptA family)
MSRVARAAEKGGSITEREAQAIHVDPKGRWIVVDGKPTRNKPRIITRENQIWPAGKAPGTNVSVPPNGGRVMSRLLRHTGSVDAEGWKDLRALTRETRLSPDQVATIVRQDQKQRFQIRNISAVPQIRAAQGHTIRGVDTSGNNQLSLEAAAATPVVHRTNTAAAALIMQIGLSAMKRNDVHFYNPHLRPELATMKGVHIQLDARRFINDGGVIRIAPNGVMLVSDNVPAQYLTVAKRLSQ